MSLKLLWRPDKFLSRSVSHLPQYRHLHHPHLQHHYSQSGSPTANGKWVGEADYTIPCSLTALLFRYMSWPSLPIHTHRLAVQVDVVTIFVFSSWSFLAHSHSPPRCSGRCAPYQVAGFGPDNATMILVGWLVGWSNICFFCHHSQLFNFYWTWFTNSNVMTGFQWCADNLAPRFGNWTIWHHQCKKDNLVLQYKNLGVPLDWRTYH